MFEKSRLRMLIDYRNLIWRLAWGDFKIRYKNSLLGFLWSLLEPMLMLLVLYVVFSYLMRIEVEHYQLFLLLGIVLWGFLDKGTNMSIVSIVGKPSMVQKVYFPREVLAISSCLTALMMAGLEFLVFLAFAFYFKVYPGQAAIYFPLIFILQYILVSGLCLALAALNVYFRDVQFIWRVVLQAGFFATPILYPVTIFPIHIQNMMMINPLARIISMSRDCLLYGTVPASGDLAYVAGTSLLILGLGYWIFRRLDPGFAEAI